jgi:hypothetical protein
MTKELYCSACMRMQPLDENWRALHIDSDGDLVLTRPEKDGEHFYERPNTVFACGEGSALVLVERYLHTRGFDLAHALNESRAGAHTGEDLTGYLT